MKTFEEVCEVAKSLWYFSDYWFREKDGAVLCLFNCNDFFFWGTADCEEYEVADIPLLEQAKIDCDAANSHSGGIWGPLLWIARKRQMRPQGAYYLHIPTELWPLFDAAGPVRAVELGNPCKHPLTPK